MGQEIRILMPKIWTPKWCQKRELNRNNYFHLETLGQETDPVIPTPVFRVRRVPASKCNRFVVL